MKWFKRIIVSILIIGIPFFAFYKPKKLNLEGNWEAKAIVLEGNKIYPDTIAEFFDIDPEIIINSWTKSISIPIYRKNVEANLEYVKSSNGKYKIKLFSSEKALNGYFDVTVDTLEVEEQSYTVHVKLESKKTIIHFEKHVIIPPWKPEFPKRNGRP